MRQTKVMNRFDLKLRKKLGILWLKMLRILCVSFGLCDWRTTPIEKGAPPAKSKDASTASFFLSRFTIIFIRF